MTNTRSHQLRSRFLEPIVFGIINADNSIRWLKRLSAAPKGRITSAAFVERTIHKLEGYGYICALMTEWNGGLELRRSPIRL